jgi:hypothetical protein
MSPRERVECVQEAEAHKPPGEGGLKVSRPVGWGIQMGRMTARWLPPRFLKPMETT